MVFESNPAPDNGVFDTNEIRKPGTKEQLHSRNIALTKGQFGQSSPEFCLGFDLIECNVPKGENLRFSTTQTTSGDGIRVSADTWNVATLDRARVNWVERKHDAKDTEFGSWSTSTGWSSRTSLNFKFKTKFTEAPDVIVWLSHFDLRWADRWRVHVFADYISPEGFNCKADVWGGSTVYLVKVNWMAVKKSKKGFQWGRFALPDEQGKENKNTSKEIKFPAGTFKNPPSILAGINMIDQPTPDTVRIENVVSDLTADGFKWTLKHNSPWTNSATYVAISND